MLTCSNVWFTFNFILHLIGPGELNKLMRRLNAVVPFRHLLSSIPKRSHHRELPMNRGPGQDPVAAAQPGMGAEPLFPFFQEPEVKRAGESTPLEHHLGGHGLGQAFAFPGGVPARGADGPGDVSRDGRVWQIMGGCFQHGAPQKGGNAPKGDRQYGQPGKGEPEQGLQKEALFN